MMQWYEILLIVLAGAFVVGVAVWQIIRKKQGKSGCDCGSCSGGCPHCAAAQKKQEENK